MLTRFHICLSALLLTGQLVAEEHWSFLPLQQEIEVPAVKDAEWNGHPIDRLIKLEMEQRNLTPSAVAERSDWLRRVTYDLTGLPPRIEDTKAFLDAPTPNYEQVVDRLLGSPHFGERWGRMWLDAVRYADSNGQDENLAMSNAWRYRDWVVQAFNKDLPYQNFLRYQLAGDLIPGGSETELRDKLIATGFLVIGPKILAEQDKEKMVMDIIDEQLDTMGRSMLGISLGCARCHDHKYDPVSIRDYYALAGIFHSTQTMADRNHVSRWNERDISLAGDRVVIEEYESRKKENEANLAAFKREADAMLRERLLDEAVDGIIAAREKPSGVWSALLKESAAHGPLQSLPRNELRFFIAGLESNDKAAGFTSGHQGLALNGKSRAVRTYPHRPELEPESFTIEARIKLDQPIPADKDSRRWIVNKNQNEWVKGHYALFIQNGVLGAYIAPDGGESREISVTAKTSLIKPGQGWVSVAMTYGNNKLAIWAEGKKLSETTVDRPRQPNTFPLRIGGREDGYSFFEEGAIDTVRIYNRVLDPGELKQRSTATPEEIGDGLILREDFEPRSDAEKHAATHAGLSNRLYGKDGPLTQVESKWTKEQKAHWKVLKAQEKELAEPPEMPHALAVTDLKGQAIPVAIRGNHLKRESETVPRGFPAGLTAKKPQSDPLPAEQSGRLELADWIVDDNPLSRRVWVNRIWQTFFNYGLVRTPDNFGPSGEEPTHPALLDWLASELDRNDGSTKKLIRQIVLSRTYRGSATPASGHSLEQDPDGRWLSRMPGKRLSAEMVRDTLLAVSGQLDRSVGGSVHTFKNRGYVRNEAPTYEHPRRTLYLPVIRDRVNPLLSTFDFSNASASCSRRDESIVAMQALFFLNAPTVITQAEHWAQRLIEQEAQVKDRITRAYLELYSRRPGPDEIARAEAFLQQHPEEDETLRWADFCHTLFAGNESISIH